MSPFARRLIVIAIAIVGLALAPAASHANVLTYTSQVAFESTASSLAIQTFDNAKVPLGSFVTMGNTLNVGTNNGIFASGDIHPGLSVAASGSNAGADLMVTGEGYFGIPTEAVFANFFIETLNFNFSMGTAAVGLRLLSLFEGSTFAVSLFDAVDLLLATFTVPVTTVGGTPTFFGVIITSGETIGRLNLEASGPNAEGVSLVEFAVPAMPVAAPSSFVLLAGGLAVLLIGRNEWRRA